MASPGRLVKGAVPVAGAAPAGPFWEAVLPQLCHAGSRTQNGISSSMSKSVAGRAAFLAGAGASSLRA